MFLFGLALELGKTVHELLSQADSRELSEWMAYYSIRSKEAQSKASADQSSALQRQAKDDLRKHIKGR